jgi:hypothetical protein
MNEIRLLVITLNAWNNANSTGNTSSNLFSFLDKKSIANLFCRSEKVDNHVCDLFYRITERDLLQNILRGKEIGSIGNAHNINLDINEKDILGNRNNIYNFFRNNRWTLFLWFREIIWLLSEWRNKKLAIFLKEFNPQIIYMPVHSCFFMHDLLIYIKKVTNARIILYTGDDMYSLRQFSISPLFWINKFILRKKIKRSFESADLIYSMSKIQINELSEEFGNKFKLLHKGISHAVDNPYNYNTRKRLKFIYTGNIHNGRWRTLFVIGKILDKLNVIQEESILHIYSGNKLSKRIEKKFNQINSIKFCGEISPEEVKKVQTDADVLVHVESFNLINKLKTRHSFSTKLVDYFQRGRCIFAVGWEEANSLIYLVENDAALVAFNEKSIAQQLQRISDNPAILEEYAKKAWDCGKRNHQIEQIQQRLYNDLTQLLQK